MPRGAFAQTFIGICICSDMLEVGFVKVVTNLCRLVELPMFEYHYANHEPVTCIIGKILD